MTPTSPSSAPTAQLLEQRLRETLQPISLEVVDEGLHALAIEAHLPPV
jgi:stress-induced morphogen